MQKLPQACNALQALPLEGAAVDPFRVHTNVLFLGVQQPNNAKKEVDEDDCDLSCSLEQKLRVSNVSYATYTRCFGDSFLKLPGLTFDLDQCTLPLSKHHTVASASALLRASKLLFQISSSIKAQWHTLYRRAIVRGHT